MIMSADRNRLVKRRWGRKKCPDHIRCLKVTTVLMDFNHVIKAAEGVAQVVRLVGIVLPFPIHHKP